MESNTKTIAERASGAAHAGARNHAQVVLDKNTIDRLSRESYIFLDHVEDLDRANKIAKS